MAADSAKPRVSSGYTTLSQLQALVGNAEEGLVLLDTEFRILAVNPAYMALVGQSRAELIGRPYFELFPDSDKEAIFLHARDTGQPFRGGVEPFQPIAQGAEASGYWRWSLRPTAMGEVDVQTLVLSWAEMTELVQTRQNLADLLHVVSHDLRSPLTAMLGQAQIIQRLPERREVVERSSAAVVAAGRRMNAMIQDVVDLIRAKTGTLKLNRLPVDLPRFASEVRRSCPEVLEADRVRVEAPESLPQVSVDPSRLERILTNLLLGALKRSKPESEVIVSFEEGTGEVATRVAAMGEPWDPEEMALLFERPRPFSPDRRPSGETSPGLYVSAVLVEAHGGRIWAESQPDGRIDFVFSLPAVSPER